MKLLLERLGLNLRCLEIYTWLSQILWVHNDHNGSHLQLACDCYYLSTWVVWTWGISKYIHPIYIQISKLWPSKNRENVFLKLAGFASDVEKCAIGFEWFPAFLNILELHVHGNVGCSWLLYFCPVFYIFYQLNMESMSGLQRRNSFGCITRCLALRWGRSSSRSSDQKSGRSSTAPRSSRGTATVPLCHPGWTGTWPINLRTWTSRN